MLCRVKFYIRLMLVNQGRSFGYRICLDPLLTYFYAVPVVNQLQTTIVTSRELCEMVRWLHNTADPPSTRRYNEQAPVHETHGIL